MDHEIEQNGFAIVQGILNEPERWELIASLGPVSGAGRRRLLGLPEVATLARSPRIVDLVQKHLPNGTLPVRAIYFDKTPESNWLVPAPEAARKKNRQTRSEMSNKEM